MPSFTVSEHTINICTQVLPLICSFYQFFPFTITHKISQSDLEFLLSAAKVSPRAPQLPDLVLQDALTPPDIPAMMSAPRKAVRFLPNICALTFPCRDFLQAAQQAENYFGETKLRFTFHPRQI